MGFLRVKKDSMIYKSVRKKMAQPAARGMTVKVPWLQVIGDAFDDKAHQVTRAIDEHRYEQIALVFGKRTESVFVKQVKTWYGKGVILPFIKRPVQHNHSYTHDLFLGVFVRG